jgi:hypothetical protein
VASMSSSTGCAAYQSATTFSRVAEAKLRTDLKG